MLTKREKLAKLLKRISLATTGARADSTAVFIFGDMRSGTNMLVTALGRCKDTECYNENDEEAFVDYRLRGEAVIRKLIRKSRASIVVFKPITDSQNAAELLHTYSPSKGIWIFRWYRDAVISALKNWSDHRRYLYYLLHDPETAAWRLENLSEQDLSMIREHYDSDISDQSARALIWYLRTKMYFQLNLDKRHDVLLVNYERLVSDPESEFKRITRFLECEYVGKMAEGVFVSSVNKRAELEIDDEIASRCSALYEEMLSCLNQTEHVARANASAGEAVSGKPS